MAFTQQEIAIGGSKGSIDLLKQSIQPEPTTKKQLKFDSHVVQERVDCLSYSSSCSVSNQPPVSPWLQSKDSSLQLVYNAFGFPSMPHPSISAVRYYLDLHLLQTRSRNLTTRNILQIM